MDILVDVATVGGREILLLVDLKQGRVDETGPGLEGRLVYGQQQVHLFFHGHFERVLDDGRAPGDLT